MRGDVGFLLMGGEEGGGGENGLSEQSKLRGFLPPILPPMREGGFEPTNFYKNRS